MLTVHVVPPLGAVPLQALKVDHLDRLYSDLLQRGRVAPLAGMDAEPPVGLSPKSVRSLHNMIHKALRDAERKRLVVRNVASAADPPRLRQAGSQEMRTWTPKEVRVFLAAMTGHRLEAAYVLAVTTGMRRGEVLGLRWQDISWSAHRLAVRQTITMVNYKILIGTPKTARGRRSIALDPTTLTALEGHRQRQLDDRQKVGYGYRDNDLVFAKEDGTPINPDFFSQTFDRTVARLAMPRIRLHDLRHTHATLGLAAGVPPKVMSDRLGHSTVAFTQDVYMHAIPRLEEQAAEQVADLIFLSHLDPTAV
jgi:integrase